MSMTYNVRQAGAVTVIDVGGRITLGEATAIAAVSGSELHKVVRDVVKNGHSKLLLNLRDVSYIDSWGIGELFGCFTTVRGQGGTLKITMPSERVQNLFNLTKLNTVIEVIQDQATAIQSFGKDETSVSAA